MIGVLIKRVSLDKGTQGKCHAKFGAVLLQAKELSEARGKAWNRTFPSTYRESIALHTP